MHTKSSIAKYRLMKFTDYPLLMSGVQIADSLQTRFRPVPQRVFMGACLLIRLDFPGEPIIDIQPHFQLAPTTKSVLPINATDDVPYPLAQLPHHTDHTVVPLIRLVFR